MTKENKKHYPGGIDFETDYFTENDFLDSISCEELPFDTIPMALLAVFEDSALGHLSESKYASLELDIFEKPVDVWDTPDVTKYDKKR